VTTEMLAITSFLRQGVLQCGSPYVVLEISMTTGVSHMWLIHSRACEASTYTRPPANVLLHVFGFSAVSNGGDGRALWQALDEALHIKHMSRVMDTVGLTGSIARLQRQVCKVIVKRTVVQQTYCDPTLGMPTVCRAMPLPHSTRPLAMTMATGSEGRSEAWSWT
jgi:hypothetical protein